jgi:hypothetical protein
MRLKNEFLSDKKKEKYRKYRNPNAFAILLAAAKRLNYRTNLKEII